MLYQCALVKRDMEEMLGDSRGLLEQLNGKTVLVTGANGMLAYYLICLLMHWNITANGSIRVVALARNSIRAMNRFSTFLPLDCFELLVQDVSEEIEYHSSVDYIVHAASSASPKYIRTDPVGIIHANVLGTENILKLAKRNTGCRVLFTSTREIYGQVVGVKYINENDTGCLDPLDSRSCYPESKRMAEQLFKSYYRQYNINYVIARIAHAYGPGMNIDSDGRVMSDFIGAAVKREPIIVNSDGRAVRAFCYITDAVRALIRILIDGANGEAYNLSNETEPVTVYDLAHLIANKSGLSVLMQPRDNDGSYCEYERVGLDCTKLMNLGWKPKVLLEQGIDTTISSLRFEYE